MARTWKDGIRWSRFCLSLSISDSITGTNCPCVWSKISTPAGQFCQDYSFLWVTLPLGFLVPPAERIAVAHLWSVSSSRITLALTSTVKWIFFIQVPMSQILMRNIFPESIQRRGGCLLPSHVNDNFAWCRIRELSCLFQKKLWYSASQTLACIIITWRLITTQISKPLP